MTEHPDSSEISRKGKGPAKIVYTSGEMHFTPNLAYTTSLKYVTVAGHPITTKGSAIKQIEWLDRSDLPDGETDE